MPAEFIIEELDGALESLIFRWNFCLRENSKEASDKECCLKIQELVEKGKAYFKLVGCWRERGYLNHYNDKIRYSLIVTISTPKQGVDLYAPIVTQIATPVEVDVNI